MHTILPIVRTVFLPVLLLSLLLFFHSLVECREKAEELKRSLHTAVARFIHGRWCFTATNDGMHGQAFRSHMLHEIMTVNIVTICWDYLYPVITLILAVYRITIVLLFQCPSRCCSRNFHFTYGSFGVQHVTIAPTNNNNCICTISIHKTLCLHLYLDAFSRSSPRDLVCIAQDWCEHSEKQHHHFHTNPFNCQRQLNAAKTSAQTARDEIWRVIHCTL